MEDKMRRLTVILAFSGLYGCAAAPVDPLGSWGGDHASLTIGVDEARVEFDCAHGRIAGLFSVKDDGSFSLAGVLVSEHGGPVQEGEVLPEQPVLYSGDIKGRQMILNVGDAAGDGSLGRFTLERDRAPMLTKCL